MKESDELREIVHEMKLQPRPFELIKKGKKIYELRLNDEKRRLIVTGDRIRFTQTQSGEHLIVTVTELSVFKNFDELYAALPSSEIGYNDDETADPADMLRYYSEEAIAANGVIAIKMAKNLT